MTTGILSIGATALDAAYMALQTTGNNIANVNTPGYSREVTQFTSSVQTPVGGGMYAGTGVDVTSITRVYNDFLAQQTNLAQAMASQADTAATLTSQVNGMFSDSTTSLGTAVDNFFNQIQTLSTDPSSAATRQSVLSAAQEMASQFNDAYAQLQQMNESTTQQIGQQVSTANSLVQQIATLNDQIALASAGNQAPNALLDQRDQDILTLNQSIGVTTNTQSNGSVNVYLANGQPLVVGGQAYTLQMGQDPQNGQNVVVGTEVGGQIAALQTNNTGGGAIGALLQFQNQTIPSVENQIGQLAVTLSSQFNGIQEAGVDATGAPGAAFFSTPSIQVTAASTNTDAGSVTLNASYSDTTQLQAASYQLSVQNGQYLLTNLATGSTTTLTPQATPAAGDAVSFAPVDGMSLGLSAVPANGDVFNIDPVQTGANQISVELSSGSQIAAGSALQATLGSANAGTLAVSSLGLQAMSSSNPYPNASLNTPVTLDFTTPTTYTVNGGTTTYTYTPGTAINLNGWSLTLTGTPAAGDTVTVSPSGSGSGDNRNALMMAQLQGLGVVDGSTLDQGYAAVVANVGDLASTANSDQTSQDAALQNAQTAESSVSGVNLDEEAANMLQFQQQYQAAAQIIQAADTIFNSLITAVDAVTA